MSVGLPTVQCCASATRACRRDPVPGRLQRRLTACRAAVLVRRGKRPRRGRRADKAAPLPLRQGAAGLNMPQEPGGRSGQRARRLPTRPRRQARRPRRCGGTALHSDHDGDVECQAASRGSTWPGGRYGIAPGSGAGVAGRRPRRCKAGHDRPGRGSCGQLKVSLRRATSRQSSVLFPAHFQRGSSS
jgi:hypothetical protein